MFLYLSINKIKWIDLARRGSLDLSLYYNDISIYEVDKVLNVILQYPEMIELCAKGFFLVEDETEILENYWTFGERYVKIIDVCKIYYAVM